MQHSLSAGPQIQHEHGTKAGGAALKSRSVQDAIADDRSSDGLAPVSAPSKAIKKLKLVVHDVQFENHPKIIGASCLRKAEERIPREKQTCKIVSVQAIEGVQHAFGPVPACGGSQLKHN